MRAGVSVPVRACRGVAMGAVVSSRVCVSAFVWVRGCPGVRTYSCVGVFFFFLLKRCIFLGLYFSCSYLFAFHCINNTRHNTIHIDHCTPCLDPFASVWLFSGFGEFFSPCRDPDPAWTPTSTWRCSRVCSPIKRQRAGIFAAGKHR